jgi:drug/metabolite transporter (DMT)-like permease
MNDQTKGLLITTIGVLAVVPDSVIVRLVSADTLTFIFLRGSLTGLVIFAVTLLQYRGKTLQIYKSLGRPGLLYAGLLVLSTFCFIYALRLTSVANALFIVSTSPVFAAIASRVFLGERFSVRMIWTTLFSLLGIAVIAFGSRGVGQASLLGDAIALCAAATLALTFTAARAARQQSMVPAIALGYTLTSLICLPFVNLGNLTLWDWQLMLILCVMFIPIGTSLLALGPRYITSAEVSLLLLLEAVIAPLLVWYIVGEDPGSYALLGGAIVLGTLFISNLIGLRKIRASQTLDQR